MEPSPLSPARDLVERFRADVEALGGGEGMLAVAVSGGPDSLALLLLACAAFPGRIRAATVDHGLRPESRREAEQVGAICRLIPCPHDILPVVVPSGGEGIQSEARNARYGALARWMSGLGSSAVLTGHHADDQAETLLMRLIRGSGVGGLSGIRARSPLPGSGGSALLLRPLLAWRRDELEAIVRAAGVDPVDDPSNHDPAYDRVRIRQRLAEMAWLDPLALGRSAAALAEADTALEATAGALSAERTDEADGAILFRPEGIAEELVRRILLKCLRRISPEAEPRGDQLTALARTLRAGGTATLAGVKCTGGTVFRFEPAPPRRSPG
jgi:tRNA(Ile)-lysidine synthase